MPFTANTRESTVAAVSHLQLHAGRDTARETRRWASPYLMFLIDLIGAAAVGTITWLMTADFLGFVLVRLLAKIGVF